MVQLIILQMVWLQIGRPMAMLPYQSEREPRLSQKKVSQFILGVVGCQPKIFLDVLASLDLKLSVDKG